MLFLCRTTPMVGQPSSAIVCVDPPRQGLAVLLDVVYNHLGPSGNYLPQFSTLLHGSASYPWGPAVNYDAAGSDEVRRFVCDNALMCGLATII